MEFVIPNELWYAIIIDVKQNKNRNGKHESNMHTIV